MRIRLHKTFFVSAETKKAAFVPKEKEIQDSIREYLSLIGAVPIRINSGGIAASYGGKRRFVKFNDTPGVSDLLVCLHGRFVAIEVKRPKGSKILPDQLAFLDSIRQAGGIAFIAKSIEDVRVSLLSEGFNVP